jgi:hypothetical protein
MSGGERFLSAGAPVPTAHEVAAMEPRIQDLLRVASAAMRAYELVDEPTWDMFWTQLISREAPNPEQRGARLSRGVCCWHHVCVGALVRVLHDGNHHLWLSTACFCDC